MPARVVRTYNKLLVFRSNIGLKCHTTQVSSQHNTETQFGNTLRQITMGELLNGTLFDISLTSSPRTFTNQRKINFNKTERVVKRVIVVQLRVAAKHKSPEGMTFVPLFVTTDDDLLDPSTCDVIGSIRDGKAQLNPSFVDKHENGSKRVKALSVRFDLEDEFDFSEDLDMPQLEDDYRPPVACKAAVKKFPPFHGKKRPRLEMESGDEEQIEESEVEDESDSELVGVLEPEPKRSKTPPPINTDTNNDTDVDSDQE